MTTVWWQCRICASELFDSDHAMEHRLTTGHNDNALVTRECPPGTGSSDEGRRRARELFESTLAARRGTAETGDDDE